MKVIKLSPAERKIGLSIRAMRADQDRADWQTYADGSSTGGFSTIGDHFKHQS
jgi:predicted RNA-binding protein with RPS1 domain